MLVVQQQKTALTIVENKIPNNSNLVKKIMIQTLQKLTDYDHDKYSAAPEFNTLAASVLMQYQHKQIY